MRAWSKPSTGSPSMTVTGVALNPRAMSSSSQRGSCVMSRDSKGMPFRERNSFSRSHGPQPGCQ